MPFSRPVRRIVSRGAAVMLLTSMVTAGVAAHAPKALAAGTVLFSQPFHDNTVDGTAGSVSLPTAPAASGNTACLTAAGNAIANPLASCPTFTDTQGSGKLRLTQNITNQEGGVFASTSVPTSQGLDVTFNTYQYGGTQGADGLAFVLAAVNPANPVTPAAIGQSGGALGYSAPSSNSPGLSYGYLGVGFDVYGNFSNHYEGLGCNDAANIAQRMPGQVVIRGPGNGGTGYCALKSSAATATSPALTLRALTRAASVVPVEVVYNPSSLSVTTPSGLVVPGGDYDVHFTPVGGAAQNLIGALPVVPSGLYPASWVNASGYPKQLAFGWVGSTGSVTDYHEIDSVVVTTLNPVPQLAVSQTSYAAATLSPGSPVTYSVAASSSGAAENQPVTVTETLPAGVLPVGASGTGWVCAAPSGQSDIVHGQHQPVHQRDDHRERGRDLEQRHPGGDPVQHHRDRVLQRRQSGDIVERTGRHPARRAGRHRHHPDQRRGRGRQRRHRHRHRPQRGDRHPDRHRGAVHGGYTRHPGAVYDVGAWLLHRHQQHQPRHLIDASPCRGSGDGQGGQPGRRRQRRLHLQPGSCAQLRRPARRGGQHVLQRPADHDRRDQSHHLVGEHGNAASRPHPQCFDRAAVRDPDHRGHLLLHGEGHRQQRPDRHRAGDADRYPGAVAEFPGPAARLDAYRLRRHPDRIGGDQPVRLVGEQREPARGHQPERRREPDRHPDGDRYVRFHGQGDRRQRPECHRGHQHYRVGRSVGDVFWPAGRRRRRRLQLHADRRGGHHPVHLVGERGDAAARPVAQFRGCAVRHPGHRGQLPVHGQRDRCEQRHRHRLDHAGRLLRRGPSFPPRRTPMSASATAIRSPPPAAQVPMPGR